MNNSLFRRSRILSGVMLAAAALSAPVAVAAPKAPDSNAQPRFAVLEQFIASPGQEVALRQVLLGLVNTGRDEAGNIRFDVLVSKSNSAQLFVWELWTNQAAEDTYHRSPAFASGAQEVRGLLLAPMSETRARMLSPVDGRPDKRYPEGSPEELTLVPFFTIKPGRIEAMRDAHLSMVGPTRSEPGDIDYDLFQVVDKPDVMFFFENWVNKAALDEHMRKPYFTRYVRGQADASVAVPWTYLSLSMISPPGSGKGAR